MSENDGKPSYFSVSESVKWYDGTKLGWVVYRGNQSRDGIDRQNAVAIFVDESAARQFVFGDQALEKKLAEAEAKLEAAQDRNEAVSEAKEQPKDLVIKDVKVRAMGMDLDVKVQFVVKFEGHEAQAFSHIFSISELECIAANRMAVQVWPIFPSDAVSTETSKEIG